MKTCKRKKSYPSWARYKTVDFDGEVCLFRSEPEFLCGVWVSDDDYHSVYSGFEENFNGDPEKSLRKIVD